MESTITDRLFVLSLMSEKGVWVGTSFGKSCPDGLKIVYLPTVEEPYFFHWLCDILRIDRLNADGWIGHILEGSFESTDAERWVGSLVQEAEDVLT